MGRVERTIYGVQYKSLQISLQTLWSNIVAVVDGVFATFRIAFIICFQQGQGQEQNYIALLFMYTAAAAAAAVQFVFYSHICNPATDDVRFLLPFHVNISSHIYYCSFFFLSYISLSLSLISLLHIYIIWRSVIQTPSSSLSLPPSSKLYSSRSLILSLYCVHLWCRLLATCDKAARRRRANKGKMKKIYIYKYIVYYSIPERFILNIFFFYVRYIYLFPWLWLPWASFGWYCHC